MNAKNSVFVICVEAIIYLLSYNLYHCAFKSQFTRLIMKQKVSKDSHNTMKLCFCSTIQTNLKIFSRAATPIQCLRDENCIGRKFSKIRLTIVATANALGKKLSLLKTKPSLIQSHYHGNHSSFYKHTYLS